MSATSGWERAAGQWSRRGGWSFGGGLALGLIAALAGACVNRVSESETATRAAHPAEHRHAEPAAIRPNVGAGATLPAALRKAFTNAVRAGDVETVGRMLDDEPLLLEARPDNDHRTPLISAAWADDLEMIELLVRRGADLEGEDYVWGGSALGWAAWNGQPDVARILIEAGAEVNHPNRGGCTPLCSAVARTSSSKYADEATSEQRAAVIQLLRDHGGVMQQDRTRPWPIAPGWDDIE